MVASAVFITDVQGKHIISRNYRGDVPITKAVEVFGKYLTEIPDEQKKPVFYHDGSEFMMEDDAGATGNKGETFVYVSVSIVADIRVMCFPTNVGTCHYCLFSCHCIVSHYSCSAIFATFDFLLVFFTIH